MILHLMPQSRCTSKFDRYEFCRCADVALVRVASRNELVSHADQSHFEIQLSYAHTIAKPEVETIRHIY